VIDTENDIYKAYHVGLKNVALVTWLSL